MDDDHAVAVGAGGDATEIVVALITIGVGFLTGDVFGDGGGQPVGGVVLGQFEEFVFVVGVGPPGQYPCFGIRQGVGGERFMYLRQESRECPTRIHSRAVEV